MFLCEVHLLHIAPLIKGVEVLFPHLVLCPLATRLMHVHLLVLLQAFGPLTAPGGLTHLAHGFEYMSLKSR